MTALLAGVLCCATGCATRSFEVDAIRDGEIPAVGPAYRIVNATTRRDEDPLVVATLGYVRTALSSKGMFEAPEGVGHDLVIEVRFASRTPRLQTVSYRVPENPYPTKDAEYEARSVTDSEGNSRVVIAYVPGESTPGSDEWVERTVRRPVYPKSLEIRASEAQAPKGRRSPREVWLVEVTNEDTEESLEASLPLMVAAAMDSIDTNDPTVRKVKLRDGDNRVLFIRRGS